MVRYTYLPSNRCIKILIVYNYYLTPKILQEETQEQVGDERQATGRSDLDKSNKGHRGQKEKANRSDATPHQEKRKQHENKPGTTEQERILGIV